MNDDEIIGLYEKRSEDAISETKKKYGNYCRTIAYNILGSHEETDECESDAYFQVWKSIPPQRPESFQSFLGRITRNLAISRYRKKNTGKRGAGRTETALSELAECVDMSGDVEKESERRLLMSALTEFLAVSEPLKRKIFVQRYFYLMSVKEIAKKEALSESHVKSALFRMRKELKKFLKDKELY